MSEIETSAPVKPVLTPVTSNLIAGHDIGYDSITIEFNKSGSVWKYSDLPREVVDGYATADSKGSFFLKQIKGKYTEEKVWPPKPEESESDGTA